MVRFTVSQLKQMGHIKSIKNKIPEEPTKLPFSEYFVKTGPKEPRVIPEIASKCVVHWYHRLVSIHIHIPRT